MCISPPNAVLDFGGEGEGEGGLSDRFLCQITDI